MKVKPDDVARDISLCQTYRKSDFKLFLNVIFKDEVPKVYAYGYGAVGQILQ